MSSSGSSKAPRAGSAQAALLIGLLAATLLVFRLAAAALGLAHPGSIFWYLIVVSGPLIIILMIVAVVLATGGGSKGSIE